MDRKSNIKEDINECTKHLEAVRSEIARKIIGQNDLINGLLMGLIAGGHVLVEGVPGLAKTMAVRAMAEVLNSDFKRVQFTPDLLPADLTGTMIYRQQSGEFVPRKGPIFTNVLLADEINRAPAKVQSALLEAMAERQVTIGEQSYILPDPFFVMATENPIEEEGTYQLPEAQLDRFLLKLIVDYPSEGEELQVLKMYEQEKDVRLNKILGLHVLQKLVKTSRSISIDERIQKYIVSLVAATRETNKRDSQYARYIEYGVSPRASLGLMNCSRVQAMFEGRSYVLPEDVKEVALNVMRHRLVLSYEAESEELTSDDIIQGLLSRIVVP